jgi:peptidoglycan/xylan/chitin deacetylase (PgdA/CDA1 family)
MVLPAHGRFDYSAIVERPQYDWPGGKRLALYVALNVETFGFGMEVGPVYGNAMPPPDHRNWCWREYGNRVGFFRLLELFDDLGIPLAHLANSYLYDTHPQIPAAIRARGDEFVGHGRTNSEKPGARPEEDERTLIRESTEAVERHEGRRPTGWMTPLMMPSTVTLDLLKEAGYRYVLDWPADDQPFWMRTRAGPLLSVPYPVETNDFGPTLTFHHDAEQFVKTLVRTFEQQLRASEKQSIVMPISLHTFIFGYPHRIHALREGLERILAHPDFDRVWLTRPGAIADHVIALPAGTVPAV